MTYKTRFTRSHDDKALEKFNAWVKQYGFEQDVVIETYKDNLLIGDFSRITITGENANVMFALRWGGPMPVVKEESTETGDNKIF